MIQAILFFLLGIFALSLILLVVKPFTELFLLKLKHGNDIYIRFIPFLGLIYLFRKALLEHKDTEYYSRQTIQQNPGYKIYAINFFLDRLLITFVDPSLIKQFFQAPEKYKKVDLLLFNDLIFSQGLLFTEDTMWKNQRKSIGQQFTFENLKNRIPIMKDITKEILSQNIKTGQEIKLTEVLSKITGDVVTQTFFGKEFRFNINSNNSEQLVNGLTVTDAVVECITLQFELSFRRLWTHLRGIIYGFKSNIPEFLLTKEEKVFLTKMQAFQKFVKAGIVKRELDFDKNEQLQNMDFIQIYLQESKKNNQTLNLDELSHQFTTFAFAGTDTTSTMTTMACYILSQKQDLQEELRAHIREHIQQFDELTHQDLPKLDKLGALFSEVLRIYPPANGIFPRQARQQHQIGPFTMKSHYLLNCGILHVQQNPMYYDKPQEFQIDRWLKNELKDPHAFIAFSSGPRNCIGQHMAMTEAKIMLTYILMNYKLIPDPKRELVMSVTSLYSPLDDRLVHFQPL